MSIRRTLLASLAAMLTMIGIVTATIAYYVAGDEANDFFDNELRQIAIYVWQMQAQPEDSPVPPLPHDPEDDFVIQIWKPDGTPIINSDSDAHIPPAATDGFSDFTGGGIAWRVYRTSSPHRTVQVSQQIAVRDELAAAASLQAALPIAISIPLSWVVLNWIIGKVIGRLQRVASRVAEREAERVDVIPASEVPREIQPLVTTVNDLVQRLQAALEQQRRFVADAAHELRTPLAAISIQTANLRSAQRDDALFAARISDLEGGIARATALVGQLLKLARFETAFRRSPDSPLDLKRLAVDCLERFAAVAERRSIDMGFACDDAEMMVSGAEEDIRVLLSNLLDNAIKYSPVGGTIDVAIFRHTGVIHLEVRDGGPGINDTDLPRVYERFFRASPVTVEGSGLGLAIAKAAADRNGIKLELSNRPGRAGIVAQLVFTQGTIEAG